MSEVKSSPEPTRSLTFGEILVGLDFNPSNRPDVDEAKQLCARLANMVNDLQKETSQPYLSNTFKGDAIRYILHAQMAIVKYLTFNK
jgi:hypothetical protein